MYGCGSESRHCIIAICGGVKVSAQVQESTKDFYAVYNSSEKTLTFKKCAPTQGDGNTYYAITGNAYSAVRESVQKVIIDESFKTYNPTTCKSFFDGFIVLTSIEGLKNLNTENVTDMSYMFSDCQKLESLDLSHFKTAKVTNMSYMFNMYKLGTKEECSSMLRSLDLSSFNTENVTNMAYMFSGCEKLESLVLSSFNTKNVTDMEYMFNHCGNLESFDLSTFNTAKVTSMKGMFSMYSLTTTSGCETKLTKLDLRNFNTENVTDMAFMFSLEKSLQSIDLSSFNTDKVTTMQGMFSNCSVLKTLDLTSFNTAEVKNMQFMFNYCGLLSKIYVSDLFCTQSVATGDSREHVFQGCSSLSGFDKNQDDYSMANYKTGYFDTYYKLGGEIHELRGENLTVENLPLDDKHDFIAYAPFTAETATYKRTMKNTWGTLCLPYAVDADQIEGCEFYSMLGINGNVLTVRKMHGTVAAGQPVMLRRTTDAATEIVFSVSNAEIVKAPIVSDANADKFVGTFVALKVPDECYAIGDNKFWLVGDVNTDKKNVWIHGFYSYIEPKQTIGQAMPLSLNIGGSTTAIGNVEATPVDLLNAAANGEAEIFDAAGCRIANLQKGLNIIRLGNKTQKVFIKE